MSCEPGAPVLPRGSWEVVVYGWWVLRSCLTSFSEKLEIQHTEILLKK